jgi:hypothetical protein
MTKEEKQAFYAQYWEQKVGKCSTQDHDHLFMVNDDHMCCVDLIELRTIEQLDRNELEILCDLVWGDNLNKNLGYNIYITDLLHIDSRGYFTRQRVVDYLRSIGILVAFRQFTPEILIAEGVVKIKI